MEPGTEQFKQEKLKLRIACIWLASVCGFVAYMLGQHLYATLAGKPDGEPSANGAYYFHFGLLFLFMASISVISSFFLLYPDHLDKYISQNDSNCCDKCGYDLRATRKDMQIRCPECGEELHYESDEK